MNHRKWSSMRGDLNCVFDEHNALYTDWKKASLEVERLAKENGDLCDEIAALKKAEDDYKNENYIDGPFCFDDCLKTRRRMGIEVGNRESIYPKIDAIMDERDDLMAQLAILHPGETVEGVVMERDSYRIQVSHLKEDLAAAKAEAEACDLARCAAEAQLAARPQPVPVKVRFEYDPAERIAAHDAGVVASDMFLHAHAVIDVPAGVPSVVELVKMVAAAHYGWDLGSVIYLGSTDVAKFTPYATAIRDAVLAGAAASQKPSSTIAAMLAAQEATRNHNSGPYGSKCPKCFDTGTIMMVGGPSQRCDCKFLKMTTPSANIEELPERPKGLPSAEGLADILKTVPALQHQSKLMNLDLARAILAALEGE